MNLPPLYQQLPVSETEKEILYNGEIANRSDSYGKNIGPLKVEILKGAKGWGYKIYTHKRTAYETSPGVIESKFKFSYNGIAESRAKQMIELYWMACNEND